MVWLLLAYVCYIVNQLYKLYKLDNWFLKKLNILRTMGQITNQSFELLLHTLTAMKKEMSNTHKYISDVNFDTQKDITNVKENLAEVKTEISAITRNFENVQTDICKMKNKFLFTLLICLLTIITTVILSYIDKYIVM